MISLIDQNVIGNDGAVALAAVLSNHKSITEVGMHIIHNSRIGRELHWKQRRSESRGSCDQKRENPIHECLYDFYQFFNIITDIK